VIGISWKSLSHYDNAPAAKRACICTFSVHELYTPHVVNGPQAWRMLALVGLAVLLGNGAVVLRVRRLLRDRPPSTTCRARQAAWLTMAVQGGSWRARSWPRC